MSIVFQWPPNRFVSTEGAKIWPLAGGYKSSAGVNCPPAEPNRPSCNRWRCRWRPGTSVSVRTPQREPSNRPNPSRANGCVPGVKVAMRAWALVGHHSSSAMELPRGTPRSGSCLLERKLVAHSTCPACTPRLRITRTGSSLTRRRPLCDFDVAVAAGDKLLWACFYYIYMDDDDEYVIIKC